MKNKKFSYKIKKRPVKPENVNRIVEILEEESREKKDVHRFIRKIKPYDILFTLLIALCTVGISVYALISSGKSSNETATLLKETTEQLKKIGELTNKQIEITNEQAETARQMRYDRLNAEAPRMQLDILNISDTNNIYNGYYKPKIFYSYCNIGFRKAIVKSIRSFVVYEFGNTFVHSDFKPYQEEVCNVNIGKPFDFLPEMRINKNEPFYFVTDIKYLDDQTGLEFYGISYLQYCARRGVFKFFACNNGEEEIIDLMNKINSEIDKKNKELNLQLEHIGLKPINPILTLPPKNESLPLKQ